MKRPYDGRFVPPAPVVPVRMRAPGREPFAEAEAKIDTAADLCAVPGHLLLALDLGPERSVRVTGFGGVPREVPVYRVDVEVAGRVLRRIEAVATPRPWGLLGRNALRYLDVRLEGPRERLTVLPGAGASPRRSRAR